jgi:hypothetical protein
MNKFYKKVSEDATSTTYNIDLPLLYEYATSYDFIDDVEGLRNEIEEALDVAQGCGEYWDDLDPKYPNNTYNWGFKLDGYLFIRGYSGEAGMYWNQGNGLYTLCRPW